MNTARKIVRDCMPIRCVEAVFLALYITAGIKKLNRFPLSFKTEVALRKLKMLPKKLVACGFVIIKLTMFFVCLVRKFKGRWEYS